MVFLKKVSVLHNKQLCNILHEHARYKKAIYLPYKPKRKTFCNLVFPFSMFSLVLIASLLLVTFYGVFFSFSYWKTICIFYKQHTILVRFNDII